jgi:hypothetical protein
MDKAARAYISERFCFLITHRKSTNVLVDKNYKGRVREKKMIK